MKEKVSIIIVNYKVKKFLFNCIESINKSTYKNIEVIVVDNDKTNKLEKDLKRKFPKIKYLKTLSNIGFSKANNLGAINSSGEHLFFLNPDTEVDKYVIEKLIKFLKKNKKAGIVAPLLINRENEIMKRQGSGKLIPLNAILHLSYLSKIKFFESWGNYWHLDWDKKAVEEVDVVPGTAFMIKKSLFEEIGGFDEDFFLFFEENQICEKVQNAGYKNYMIPEAKVKHYWGESTKQNPETNKIFKKSRFLYFKKNYGLIKAISVTMFLNFGKYQLLILLIIFLSLFLNLYEINNRIRFIGDQAWFYISAKDMLLSGNIPLVGITSSHTWLHQGAFWTYLLAFFLKISNFNPLTGFYFVAILGSITVYLVYKLGSILFTSRIGIIAAFLYAVSPLIIIHTRMSYHTTPIPFFTILFLFSIYKWIKGNVLFFPISIFFLAVLYNLELATFSFIATFGLIFLFGFFRKQKWAIEVLKIRIIIYSIIAFFVPMLSMLLYDISHGFPQTLKFGVWIFYRIAVLLGYPPINPQIGGETWYTFYNYNSLLGKDIIFYPSLPVAFVILIASYLFFIYLMFAKLENKKERISYLILFVFFTIPFLGFLSQKTNSEAYLLIFFPTVMLMIGIFFDSFIKNRISAIIVVLILLIIGFVNIRSMLSTGYTTDISFNDRLNAAKYIIKEANGRPYNIVGTGPGSEHRSFTMNHEYLTWYLGSPPSTKKEKLQFIIFEEPYKIKIEKKEL